jgi:hypothetical protein
MILYVMWPIIWTSQGYNDLINTIISFLFTFYDSKKKKKIFFFEKIITPKISLSKCIKIVSVKHLWKLSKENNVRNFDEIFRMSPDLRSRTSTGIYFFFIKKFRFFIYARPASLLQIISKRKTFRSSWFVIWVFYFYIWFLSIM